MELELIKHFCICVDPSTPPACLYGVSCSAAQVFRRWSLEDDFLETATSGVGLK